MPARNLSILVISCAVSVICYLTATRNHYGGLLSIAMAEVQRNFVHPVDDRTLFEGAMDGMLRQLDQYSDYITPEELVQFKEDMDQVFGGVGIVVEMNTETDRLTVASPLPGTPGSEAGIRAGDQIMAIDGHSTVGMQIADAVKLMRGKPGTTLTVSVLHPQETEPTELTITRAVISVDSVMGDVRNADGSWQFTLQHHPRIGYIRLISFGDKSAAELQAAVTSVQDSMDGLILDLRGNGGGLLTSAVEVCNLFIASGTIVSIRGRDTREWVDYAATGKETILPNLPMAVLVDGYSASASEIAAACLQDHHRATIVGQRTWGKGTVQNVMSFEGRRSAIKLTIATYWRPSGANIHRDAEATPDDAWGVTPDAGYDVSLNEDEIRQIVLQRRQRDRAQQPTLTPAQREPSPPPSPANSEQRNTNPLPAVDEDLTHVQDRQLLRAVDAIHAALQSRNLAPPSSTEN